MKKRIRLRFVVVFILAVCSGTLLLRVSQNVQHAEDRLAALNESVQQEEDSIRFLKAEWAYLNNPERLEKLAKKYTDLVPPSAAMMAADANDVPPREQEKMMPVSYPLPPQEGRGQGREGSVAKADSAQTASTLSPRPSPPLRKGERDFTEILKNIRREGAQ